MNTICVIVNDFGLETWDSEHGLSLLIDWEGERILFDTGMGRTLIPNLTRFAVDPGSIRRVILSHGHNDHTGGLGKLFSWIPSPIPVYSVPGIARRRYSFSPPVTADALRGGFQSEPVVPRDISTPPESAAVLDRIEPGLRKDVADWTEILPGVILTGPIPRYSGETAGGAFYLDTAGTLPDTIEDEQALILVRGGEGTLVHGCCHSGIINTLEYCRAKLPGVSIKTVIGGLHLVRADQTRLERTLRYLECAEVERLWLLHCTGQTGIDYLKKSFSGEVLVSLAGSVLPPL